MIQGTLVFPPDKLPGNSRLLATSGDTTRKLWLTGNAAGAARVEMRRDADGSDRSLLHAQPFCPLEIWSGSR